MDGGHRRHGVAVSSHVSRHPYRHYHVLLPRLCRRPRPDAQDYPHFTHRPSGRLHHRLLHHASLYLRLRVRLVPFLEPS